MDDNSHIFLIKDKIRCIQKKIMDQLAADLNNALNDTHMLTSSISNLPSSITTIMSKNKRRRKRQINNDISQQKTQASGSTTPENTTNKNNKQSIVSDSDDMAVTSKTRSSSLIAASESDSASRTDEIRRHRRPFKKPTIPSSLKTDQLMKLTRCSSIKTSDSTTTTTNASIRRRRRNCHSESNSRLIDVDKNSIIPSSSTCSSTTIDHTNFAGKRKRSRAIVHDDFRLRNNSVHDYDMTNIDETNLTNFSSSSSLNLSDSDKDPCLTSNEADDEQSDWPRDESSVPRVISWWEENNQDKSDDDDDDDDDNDEKMLTTTDGTLQKIVHSALHMMLGNSKTTTQNRIQSFVSREMLTGNRRNLVSKNAYTHPHPKRHVRLLRDTRRSHHSSYSHKRVKSDHYPSKQNDFNTSIDQNSRTSDNIPMDISERMENEQNLSLSRQSAQT